MELSWCWIFFYDAAEYLMTRHPAQRLAGNAPIVVRTNGQLHVTGTARPLEEYLKEIRKKDVLYNDEED